MNTFYPKAEKHPRRYFIHTPTIMIALGVMLCAMLTHAAAISPARQNESANLLNNGNFESGLQRWLYEQWSGKTAPGYLDRDHPATGQMAFRMTDPHGSGLRYMALSSSSISVSNDYQLNLMLSCHDVPKNGVFVRVLQFGSKPGKHKAQPVGFITVPPHSGVTKLIETGGTYDWRRLSVTIPHQSIKKATQYFMVYVYDQHIDQGVVGIDAVSLTAIEPPTKTSSQQTLARPSTSYDTTDPTVLKVFAKPKIAIRLKPEKSLYRLDKTPDVEIETAVKDSQVQWKILDGFHRILRHGEYRSERSPGRFHIKFPDVPGYYEIVARVIQTGKDLGQARHSLGIIRPSMKTTGREPFGLWVEGESLYPRLGVRWTRLAFYYHLWKKDPDGYIAQCRARIKKLAGKGIRVLMYPKTLPPKYAVTKKVIKDTPAAWKTLRQYWISMVRGLHGSVDAWGVINEPYRGMWKGNDKLIIKYWTLMHNIVEKYDPNTPLIGPCLNINKPSMMAQLDHLYSMGFGKLVDGIEIHSYTGMAMPASVGWNADIKRLRAITRKAVGHDLPIYSSEMGISTDYDQELYQAKYLVRCFLQAKKMKFAMLNWHMFSWPQGPNLDQRNFAIFRNYKKTSRNKKVLPPQPRPAGVAYAVMTRQLAGTEFKRTIHYFGPSIEALAFSRPKGNVLVLWSLDKLPHKITVSVGQPQVTVTDMFGTRHTLKNHDGLLTLTVNSSPQYISPISAHLLNAAPIAQVKEPIELLPGSQGAGTLVFHNPTSHPAHISIDWIPIAGWYVRTDIRNRTLASGKKMNGSIHITSPKNATPGIHVLYGQLQLNGQPAGSVHVPIHVKPIVQIVSVKPTLRWQLVPALAVQLQRNDPSVKQTRISLDGTHHSAEVVFDGHNQTSIVLPASGLQKNALQPVRVNVSSAENQPIDSTMNDLSFVPGFAFGEHSPTIDGNLKDWPQTTIEQKQASFNVRWGWTRGALYLAVRVKDAQHIQDEPLAQMWKSDSIQIGIAPSHSSQWIRKPVSEMHEADFTQLNVGLYPGDHVRMFRDHSPNHQTAPLGEVSEKYIRASVRQSKNITYYELCIPIKQVGLKNLKPGEIVRVSIVINNNDGHGRQWQAWFGGLARGKDPAKFGQLILLSDSSLEPDR